MPWRSAGNAGDYRRPPFRQPERMTVADSRQPDAGPSVRTRLVRPLATMGAIGLGIHFLLPQLAGLQATGRAIANGAWWLVPVLMALEAAALAAYGQLLVVLLRRSGQEVEAGFVQRATLVGNAVGRALPGGSGTSFALMITSFRGRGYDPVRTGSALWGAGLLSSCVLGLLLPIGAMMGLLGGHGGRIGVSAAVGVVAVGAFAALVPVGLRDPDGLADRVRGLLGRLPGLLRRRLDLDGIRDGVQRGAANVLELATDPVVLRRAVLWAVLNWGLDIAVVLVLAMTVGAGTPLTAVLLAYVIAQLAAAIPLTPGGVGPVETAMIAALVASGTPAAPATATVLGWRLVSHWIPIPVGLALLPTLSLGRRSAGSGGDFRGYRRR